MGILATLVAVLPTTTFVAVPAVVLASALTGAITLLDRVRDQDAKVLALSERLDASSEARTREAVRADRAERELAKLQEQLVVADRRVSVGRLAAGVAHEIANPLAYVSGNLEWLESQLRHRREQVSAGAAPAEELAGGLDDMARAVRDGLEGTERVRCIVQQLKGFARGRADEPCRAMDVAEAVEVAVAMTRHETKHRASLVRAFGPAPRVVARSVPLAQVFVNLIVNAAHAIPPGAADTNEIRIAIGTDLAGWATVAVSDSGVGMESDVRARLFEPFFTTKPDGEGTGLGLSISLGIVAGLGGEIRVESAPGHGSTFTVRLPPYTGEAIAPEPRRDTPAPRGRRILAVDDEPLILAMLARTMRGWGEVCTAASGRDALALLREGPLFDVVVCDVMMPEMTGVDLYRAVEAEAPQQAARFVFVTGGAQGESACQFLEAWSGPLLLKPLDLEQLRSTIHERRW